MKRYIKSATSSYKVLDESDIKSLSDALASGNNYNEWSYWMEAMSEVGKKYIQDPDEYQWFEQNCEELYQIDQVDKLLSDQLKNHYVYDITTDDFDDDDNTDDGFYYCWYILMKGENSPQGPDGDIDYDSPNYLADYEDIDSASDDIKDPNNNYTYPLSLWKAIEDDDSVTCELLEVFH